MDPIVAFYTLEGRDHRGRSLNEMWEWDDGTLESVHDYIQWMFPTEQASAFNPQAPEVTAATRQAFATGPALRGNLQRSFDRMLAFYGFQWDAGHASIVEAPAFDSRSRAWLRPGNHNHLRITRILDSLGLLSLPRVAVVFFAALDEVYGTHPSAISQLTHAFWSDVADRARRSAG